MGLSLLDCDDEGCGWDTDGGASDEMPPWYHADVCMDC